MTAIVQSLPRVSVEHILLDDDGCARLAGHRIKVQHLAALKQTHAYSAEQIQSEVYPHLTLGEVYAALAYYHDHQMEIDRRIKEDEQLHDERRREQQHDPSYQELVAKIRARAAGNSP
jgi:uncharacterized protein (DUF433 family)